MSLELLYSTIRTGLNQEATIYPPDDPTLVAREILSLSKLNYNSARFAYKKPITLAFAEEVKKILSEMPPDAEFQNRHKFYM